MPRGQYERKPKVLDVTEFSEPVHTDLSVEITEKMNAHALRVWQGQSPDLPLRDRVFRIVHALTEQGYSLEGLKLPAKGFEIYL